MNSNLRAFIKDLEKMQEDKTDSITYGSLSLLAEALMLDEILCGEADPVEFLKETLIQVRVQEMKAYHERRLLALEEKQL